MADLLRLPGVATDFACVDECIESMCAVAALCLAINGRQCVSFVLVVDFGVGVYLFELDGAPVFARR
jgi:hypothetical protein